MKKKTVFSYVTLLLVLTLVLAGCGNQNNNPANPNNSGNDGGSEGQEEARAFRLNLHSEPPSLDPALMEDNVSGTIATGIYEGLTRKDESGNTVEGMAESWEISEDGKTYTFKIRSDAKWSNGDPVTANDFEFAWKRALDPAIGSTYAYQFYYIAGAQDYNEGKTTNADAVGVKALDAQTLEVKLNSPTPYFLGLTSFYTYNPVHQSAKENAGWAADAATIIGNGPFKMGEWQHNTSIKLVPNENYYAKDQVKFTSVDFTMIADSATELANYETDQLDYTGKPTGEIPAEQIPVLAESKKDEFHQVGTASSYYYMFNMEKAPFNNVKVRKALAMAIDRQSIVEDITQAGELPAFGFVPPGIVGVKGDYRDEVKDDFFKEDVEEAKKLLAEGLEELGLSSFPEVKLTYNTNDSHKAIADAIVDMWKTNLGINVGTGNEEWAVFLENRNAMNFDVQRSGWGADYNDPMTYMDMFVTKGGQNNTGFASAEYDALIQKAYASSDQQERIDAMKEAEKILMDQLPILPIYYYSSVYMLKPGFENIYLDYKGDIEYTRGYYVAK
ncbi:peptide ABC transporter substrate-binding protein [Paenibacillus harenae]|uniref:Oligopeptide transport system substrate-binding protein n=1 Tax=Paenibacillus harenae TaxID=306543 RepID=A0ABT9U4F8_PAEHA|nr:peptide ABC transporter substrate-binding protein [Paenibacillus harenae]MDQ0113575.1 oligopeptide transport system substrate-binding protein [Paenibacillus harenae]